MDGTEAMALCIEKLTSHFGAGIAGPDLARALDAATVAEILAAFDEYSVLVFHDQPMDDEQQIEFSKYFGTLETTISANPAGGSAFARQSNLDIETGEVIPPEDKRMIYQRGNYLWHSDSSFKETPALCSLLSARKVPGQGGDTEFASTRAAYDALPETMKARIEDLIVEHDFSYSRSVLTPGILTDGQICEAPPVRHRLVRSNPRNGRRSMLIGAHASHIVGWPPDEGRELLQELLERTTRPDRCYQHHWRNHDIVIWDNRCCLHRATPYDAVNEQRLMQRTTVAGSAATI